MYRHIEKLRKVAEDNGIKFTVLKSERSFEYLLFEHEAERRNTKLQGNIGYSWPGHISRWCTSKLKVEVMNNYFADLKKRYKVVNYVGIAIDEQHRQERQYAKKGDFRFPLIEWGMTEAECLQYCYDHGYDWEGLYNIFRRVSCWCCPLQQIGELRKLRKHFPDLWEQLKDMDNRTWRNFKPNYSVEDLEVRFQLEEEFEAKGMTTSPYNKLFRETLKERLGRS